MNLLKKWQIIKFNYTFMIYKTPLLGYNIFLSQTTIYATEISKITNPLSVNITRVMCVMNID